MVVQGVACSDGVEVGGADRLVGGCPALEEMRGRVKDVGQTGDL